MGATKTDMSSTITDREIKLWNTYSQPDRQVAAWPTGWRRPGAKTPFSN